MRHGHELWILFFSVLFLSLFLCVFHSLPSAPFFSLAFFSFSRDKCGHCVTHLPYKTVKPQIRALNLIPWWNIISLTENDWDKLIDAHLYKYEQTKKMYIDPLNLQMIKEHKGDYLKSHKKNHINTKRRSKGPFCICSATERLSLRCWVYCLKITILFGWHTPIYNNAQRRLYNPLASSPFRPADSNRICFELILSLKTIYCSNVNELKMFWKS